MVGEVYGKELPGQPQANLVFALVRLGQFDGLAEGVVPIAHGLDFDDDEFVFAV